MVIQARELLVVASGRWRVRERLRIKILGRGNWLDEKEVEVGATSWL